MKLLGFGLVLVALGALLVSPLAMWVSENIYIRWGGTPAFAIVALFGAGVALLVLGIVSLLSMLMKKKA